MKRLAYLCLLLIACGETEPENQSPMPVGTIPDVEMTTMADTAFDVSGYFTDDDGDTLISCTGPNPWTVRWPRPLSAALCSG